MPGASEVTTSFAAGGFCLPLMIGVAGCGANTEQAAETV